MNLTTRIKSGLINVKYDHTVSLKKIKLVMCTSDVQPEDGKQLQAAGFDAFLTKPVESNQLMNCLRLVLGLESDPCRQAPRRQRLITKKEIEEAQLNAPNILVVEDNIVNQKLIMKLLQV